MSDGAMWPALQPRASLRSRARAPRDACSSTPSRCAARRGYPAHYASSSTPPPTPACARRVVGAPPQGRGPRAGASTFDAPQGLDGSDTTSEPAFGRAQHGRADGRLPLPAQHAAPPPGDSGARTPRVHDADRQPSARTCSYARVPPASRSPRLPGPARPQRQRLPHRAGLPRHPGRPSARASRTRFHDLRHTAASLMIKDGKGQPKQIMEALGHADINTTYKRYGHLFDGHDAAMLDALDAGHERRATSCRSGARRTRRSYPSDSPLATRPASGESSAAVGAESQSGSSLRRRGDPSTPGRSAPTGVEAPRGTVVVLSGSVAPLRPAADPAARPGGAVTRCPRPSEPLLPGAHSP